jgi:molybdopterin synthase sulfur carrier subunit
MKISILFFGATADETGKRSFQLPIAQGITSGTAIDQVLANYPRLSRHRLLFAVNQQYVSKDTVLNDGDELAIFTAVSGG